MERLSYQCSEVIHQDHEEELKVEIVDLKDKIGDFRLCNDYLDSKVFKLEDIIERKKIALQKHLEKEKRYSFQKMMVENQCNFLEKDLVWMSSNAAYNQRHLIEYMKYTEFQKEKADRITEVWKKTDAKRVGEFKEMQESLPPETHKKPRKETFRIEPTRLNLAACSSEDYPEVEKTQELEEALEYISRLHCIDVELQEMDHTPTPPPHQG